MRRFADPGSRSPQNTARGMLLIAASFTLAVVVGCDNGSFLRRDAATGIGDAATGGNTANGGNGGSTAITNKGGAGGNVQVSPRCDPLCHWDCFGGAPECADGKVWAKGAGPRSCCKQGEPWPGPGPLCSLDSALLTCALGCEPLSPMNHCLRPPGVREVKASPAVLSLHCAGASIPDAGAAGAPDAGLSDANLPTTLGQSCGLKRKDISSSNLGPSLMKGVTCDLCFVRADANTGCLPQVCTQACTSDLGCPSGSTCRCIANPDKAGNGDLRLFCVPIEYKGENEVYGWPRCEP